MKSAALRQSLLAWYRRNARDLPWRRTDDPYAIWVSEVMLQQTQVATAAPYFERFMARFPTLDSLRSASEQSVLAAWQGLGYYQRARNLHKAAQLTNHVPNEKRALLELPGIGDYTASAIASIAFCEKHAAIDGNAERVLSRLFCINDSGSKLRQSCESLSLELIGRSRPGEWNQAVMELGATICRPFDPDCANCPVAAFCQAHINDKTHRYPKPRVAAQPVQVHHICVCPVNNGRVGIRQIPEGRWWSGMWEFPRAELLSGESHAAAIQRLGYNNVSPLTTIRHTVTRHSITLRAFISAESTSNGVQTWVTFDQLESLPLPAPQRKVAQFAMQAVLSRK